MVLLPSPQSVVLNVVALIITLAGQSVDNQFHVLPNAGLMPQ